MYTVCYTIALALLVPLAVAQQGLASPEDTPASSFHAREVLAAGMDLDIAPAAFTFDASGALLVAGSAEDKESASAGTVLRIEDRDGDGLYESSAVYAAGLRAPTAVQCWNRGVLIADAPELLYAEDTSGDHRANRIQIVFTGFETTPSAPSISGLIWGPGLRIYGVTHGAPGQVRRADAPGATPLLLGGGFALNPLRWSLSSTDVSGRRAMDFDGMGREYTLDEAGVPVQAVYPAGRVAARSHRLRTEALHPLGEALHADALTIYAGDAWPKEYRGRLILADEARKEIVCMPLASEGAAMRADVSTREVLFRGDDRFQPVQLAHGPDGNVHVLDASNRLYCIAHATAAARPVSAAMPRGTEAIVPLLAHENRWHRQTAARMLYAAQDSAVIPAVQALAQESPLAEGRATALEVLAGMEAITPELLTAALDDSDPIVRVHAVRLSEAILRRSAPEILSQRIRALSGDPDATVRLQVAFILGALPLWDRIPALEALLRSDGASAWLPAAIVALPSEGILPLIGTLVRDHDFIARPEHESIVEQLAWHLGDAVSNRADAHETLSLLELLEQERPEWGAAMARVMALASSESNNPRLSHAIFSADASTAKAMQEALSFARAAAAEHDAPKPLRLAAVQLLAHDDPGEAGPVLGALLAPATPVSLQHAALDTITQLRDPEKAVQIIAEAWPVLGPITRIRALGQLIARGECLPPLLDVVAEGTIGIRAFDAGQVALLTQHKDPGLRTRAREIFKDYFAGPHAETVARFRPALQRPASFEHGRTLFMENCSKCHTFNGEGFRVGPDLAFMARAGGDRLLKAILDPNAEVNPLYFSYTIETGDFQTITGIIAAEDDASLLVRGPSGEENVISRDNIDTMSTFNQSLMPEGWDSAFGEQGIADLIAYLSLAAIRGR